MALTSHHLVVRADTAPGAGAGHAMREIALVERWRRGGDPVTMVLDDPSPDLAARARAAGADVVLTLDSATVDTVLAQGPDVVVLDGYGLRRQVQEAIGAAGPVLAVVDDHGRHGAYAADLVIDPNLGPSLPAHGDRPAGSGFLHGPRFALLRQEFRDVAVSEPEQARVVVLLGGADGAASERVATRLEGDLGRRAIAVTTPARAGLETDVAALLGSATLVVSASGSTAWELCHLGRPTVLVALADNQEPVGAALARAGAARYVGHLDVDDPHGASALVQAVTELLDDPEERHRLSHVGPTLVDGLGSARIFAELRSSLVSLRSVRLDDARLLWEWVNDPEVRTASFHWAPIPWEEHEQWLKDGLGDAHRHHFLAVADGQPWGQVRFDDLGDGVAEIGLSVAAEARGNGGAAMLIRAGVRRLFAESDAISVSARVRADNHRSVSAFLCADFEQDERSSDNEVSLFYARGRDGRA